MSDLQEHNNTLRFRFSQVGSKRVKYSRCLCRLSARLHACVFPYLLLRARGEGKIAKRSAKASQMSADQDAWENNRLLTSGAMFAGEVSLNFDDGEDQRVQLIVHSLKPPFLDGRVSFSMQQVCNIIQRGEGGGGIRRMSRRLCVVLSGNSNTSMHQPATYLR